MKRILFAMTVLLLLSVAPVSAYADTLNAVDSNPETVTTQLQEVEFTVSGGIRTDGKTEATFDETRTISGSAEEGTLVTINVSMKDASGETESEDSYSLEVGVSGLFSQTIDLCLGENVITVTAEKEGLASVCEEATIKRKKRDIKTELENGISIPGNGMYSVKPSVLSFR